MCWKFILVVDLLLPLESNNFLYWVQIYKLHFSPVQELKLGHITISSEFGGWGYGWGWVGAGLGLGWGGVGGVVVVVMVRGS